MVSFQASAFESRHRWKLASSTLFFNEFVYRTVPVVLLILCVHCFAVKPSYHDCHFMQQKLSHLTWLMYWFFLKTQLLACWHRSWYLWFRLILGRVFFLTCFFLAIFGIVNLLISCCASCLNQNVNCRHQDRIVIHHFHIGHNTPCSPPPHPPPPPTKKKRLPLIIFLVQTATPAT